MAIETQAKTDLLGEQPSDYYNRKMTDPSALMHAPDGSRYRCSWIENGISVHADGNVTCGLDDPYSRRSFGNVNDQSVAEIWANPEYDRLVHNLWNGHRCMECGLAQKVDDQSADQPVPVRAPRPTTLVAEATIRCNLRCAQIACIPNNDKTLRTRNSDFLGLETFCRVADDLAGNINHVFFFNYGDPFVNRKAEDMLAHLHRTSPDARVVTSTNGIPLAKLERARNVVTAGALDHMVFTIGGATQESYARYHVGGRLEFALQGMANIVRAKREQAVTNPIVQWRYLLFHWNDSDAEIKSALRLAEEIGVDEFSLHLTQVPLDAMSYRFGPGSPNFARYRNYIQNAFGYTTVSPQPDADGFYPLERTAQGPARWTGWQARMRLTVTGGKASLTVSTARPGSDARTDHAFIITPWERIKVALKPGIWRKIEVDIPPLVSTTIVDIEIVTFDHWFPAEECGSTDQRCLGILVRDPETADDHIAPWREHIRLDQEDEARLANFSYRAPAPLVDW